MENSTKEYLSVKDVAKRENVSDVTVRSWIERGTLEKHGYSCKPLRSKKEGYRLEALTMGAYTDLSLNEVMEKLISAREQIDDLMLLIETIRKEFAA